MEHPTSVTTDTDAPTAFETFGKYELPDTITQGGRNDELYHYACSCWAKSYTPDKVLDALKEANETKCNPALPDSELVGIRDSVCNNKQQGYSESFKAHLKDNDGRQKRRPGNAGKTQTLKNIDDVTVGELFAETHRSKLRAVPTKNNSYRWYAYDGTRWTKDGNAAAANAFRKFTKDLIKTENAEFYQLESPNEEQEKEHKSRLRALNKYITANKRATMLKDVAPLMAAKLEDFDANRGVFNVLNGTIELRPEVRFREHRPEDLITKVAGCSYDPDAAPTKWLEFIKQTFKGETADVPSFLQVSLGLALAGDTSKERFYQFYGEPRSGKSTTVDVLESVLGDYAHTSSAATFLVSNRSAQSASADLMALRGIRLATVHEWPDRGKLNAAFLKSFTGNDRFAARGVFAEDEVNIEPTATLVFCTNYMLSTDDPTLTRSGRAVVIPFSHSLSECQQDTDLKRRLTAPESLSGVLNWLLSGWKIYLATGKVPHIPDSCKEAAEEYALDTDNVARFIEEACIVGDDLKSNGNSLYASYSDFCKDEGEEHRTRTRKDFYKQLESHGLKRGPRGNGGVVVLGIAPAK